MFSQEVTSLEKEEGKAVKNSSYEEYVTNTRMKWKYNPFRNQKDTERVLFGWQDPNAFITRFFVGGIVGVDQMYQNTSLNTDDILVAYSPVIATEAAPIAFEIDRLKMRIGVGFLAELKLHIYEYGKRQYYGNSMFMSDFLNVTLFVDFIIDDVWKLRFSPVVHYCAHGNTDYYGSPTANAPTDLVEMGTESMSFELYHTWRFLTVYGGFKFPWNGVSTSTYSTLFGLYMGMDIRVPLWGYINFITGAYFGVDYDNFNVLRRTDSGYRENGYELISSRQEWHYAGAFGIGLEIDRLAIAFKYRRMRSRHVTSYQNIDEFYGLEATIYF
ncbi:MAG: hypothetical protein ACRC9L_05160 [Brevinema sp.]